jgi:hypothetical protein
MLNEMRMKLRDQKLIQLCDYCRERIEQEDKVDVLYGDRQMTVHSECFRTGYVFRGEKQ